jgi:hypothetical protein
MIWVSKAGFLIGSVTDRLERGFGERKSLLFCEQKRSKKNFDSVRDVTMTVPHLGNQSFFGSFFVTPKPVWECRLKISLAVWLWM